MSLHLAGRVHSAVHHVVDALDGFDREMDGLRKDVHDGGHDALFDPEAMNYAMTTFAGGGPNVPRPGERPRASCRHCGGPAAMHLCSDGEWFEEDEDPAAVMAAFDAGRKLVTRKPRQ